FIQGNYDTREFYYEWIPTSPGTHTIRAEARVVSSDPLDVDIDITNNFASLNITVFPKILLIDDDNHASDKSREDTVGFMEAALTTLGFKYEVYRIKSGANGPAFSIGDHNLSGYGIVIWMCGYQTSSTLTPSDIENLKLYLNSQLRSLWLIGAGILDDLSPTDGDTTIGSFVESYLRVKSVQHNVGIPNPIVGVPTHWMTSGYQFVTSTSGVPNTADTIVPNTNAEGMFYNETSGQNLSLTYEFPNTGSKLCFQAYPISQLRNLNDIATVAYKVIKWLGGNITIMSGQDVSVSQQEIDNTHPYYMDTIQISGVVRNNRDTPISNVRVRVMLDGITKLNETVIPLLDTGTSQNAYCWVYANWTANSLGLHNIQIIADPLDEIIETDETNNIAPIDFSTTEVFVMYDILIVDDDNSENNGGVNATEYITNAFSRLGYNYSYFLVNETTAWNGPDNETMLSYNLVIWCTGIETTNTLTAEDRQVVARYLNSYGYFWLIGSGWVNDIRTNDVDFLRNVLHVQSETLNLELRRELKGNDNDFTLRGKRFQTEQPTGYEGDIVDSIVPDAQSVGIIYDENNLRCFALKYDNPDPANKAKLMLFSFDLANIMNESFPRELSLISTQSLGNEREELIYLCARWFGIPDSRIELKIEKIDFTYSMPPRIMNRDIEQLIPIVGDTFVLHARVYNVGSSRGDCVVRFVDGDTIINSVTISVGANSSTIAEVIWRPLFAGTRTISVIIDPTSNINTSISPADYTKEIFQHNNVINHTCIVYYFYDDMELGSHNWVHDTTLVNINGEVPLEFLDMYGPVNINVTSSWNTTGTIGLNKTSKIYHSLNNSYYIKEPSPEPKPVDVVLAIDT
ncbi:MAG: CARDB domain-containing protein, partial [Thermoplasmata archaeon]